MPVVEMLLNENFNPQESFSCSLVNSIMGWSCYVNP